MVLCIHAGDIERRKLRIASGIVDDGACRAAAAQEIIRRRFRVAAEYALGICDAAPLRRVEAIMEALELKNEQRSVVLPARRAAAEAAAGKGNDGIYCGAAIELADGRIVTGRNSRLFHAAGAVVLNAAKLLAGIPDRIHLLPPVVTSSLGNLKLDVLGRKSESLNLDEAGLRNLGLNATSDPVFAGKAAPLP